MTDTLETKELTRRSKILIGTAIFLVFVGLPATAFYFSTKGKAPEKTEEQPAPSPNIYTTFLLEVYDKIKGNYWEKIADEKLANLYGLAIEKLTNKLLANKPIDRITLEKTLSEEVASFESDSKKIEFASQLADAVLANLEPFGRSRLYTQKQEVDLKNRIENRNPEVDQYQVLGLSKDASQEDIKKTYEQKSSELKKDQTPEAKEKQAELERAYLTLSDPQNRKNYDEFAFEPTMASALLRPDIFYIRMEKFSPTMIQELVNVTSKVDNGEVLDTLIFDLRNNVGGLIDGLPFFLGPFIGNDQYAYQFYHQGEKTDFKTKIGWLPSLVRYKKVIVLINHNTQSSAEVMASVLKKYNVGLLVGEPTRGWGTVEKVFEISSQIDPGQKFSLFLVHEVTLREDGQPIEGRGVEPVINIHDPKWKEKLFSYYHYPELVNLVSGLVKQQ